MGKKNKINNEKIKTVKSINNNIRSSVRKLNPILKPYSSVTIILSEAKKMESHGTKS